MAQTLSLSPPCCVSRYVCTTLETKVYRPSAWAAHGMDIEGQDYRACQNYGPLSSVNTLLPDVMPGRSGYRA
ncbi:hypothetical protein ACVXHB_19065 [Escherichia coli]